jgi:hypothetical protein
VSEPDTNAGGSPPAEPPDHHGHRCREVVVLAMRAFLDLLDNAVVGETIAVDAVRRIAQAVMAAEGALASYYDHHAGGCAAFFELIKIERHRTDFFGRALVEPLVPLFDDVGSGVDRKVLPHLFAAIRMILGDELYTDYKDRCTGIANELRAGADFVPWEKFHADARVQQVREDTLVAIANSFKRFAPRKDWFLIVMNNDPKMISLGSNMFVPKSAEDMLEHAFGEANFVRMIKALFTSVRPGGFDAGQRASFLARHGATPEAVFGAFFVELTMLEQRQAAAVGRRKGFGIETRRAAKPRPATKRK